MGMSSDGFLRRLQADKAVNCVYWLGELNGLICAWRYNGAFVLTWEECLRGDHCNEQNYTRDEIHNFATAEEVLAFVEGSGYPASRFSP